MHIVAHTFNRFYVSRCSAVSLSLSSSFLSTRLRFGTDSWENLGQMCGVRVVRTYSKSFFFLVFGIAIIEAREKKKCLNRNREIAKIHANRFYNHFDQYKPKLMFDERKKINYKLCVCMLVVLLAAVVDLDFFSPLFLFSGIFSMSLKIKIHSIRFIAAT